MKTFSLFLALFLSIYSSAQTDADILIKNGRVIDGTGNSWYYADVAVKNGKIIKMGKNLSLTSNKTIDAKGLVVAPGFIDVHGHIEGGIITTPEAANYIYDGVTTVITGNCGGSAADIKRFYYRVDSVHSSINVSTLIGHNTIREQVMNEDDRKPTPAEQAQMEALVTQAMKDGALGLSTGLIYIPGTFAETEEVVGLAKAAAQHNGIYASHIRNEENEVVPAIEEALHIGRSANIPVQISHFKIGGKVNWGNSSTTIGMIEKARSEGWDVTIDQYPYTASSTNLGVRLPDWAFAAGNDSLRARLHNPSIRKQIKKDMLKQLDRYGFKNYSYAVVASYQPDSTFNGKNISEINKLMGRKSKAHFEAETIMDMIEKGGAQMVYHSMNEKDVKYIMQYPFSMFGADAGVPQPGKGMPHPRGYGTNARVLGKYVRDEKVIGLEEAIRRMSSLAAQKFGLTDRGLLKEGMAADIVIFDEKTVTDLATFDKPHAYSRGFKYVLVNGIITVEDEKHTGARGGTVLRGSAWVQPANTTE
ncbi:MAG: D-aminoacylase [Chitinophagaceae bacterium]|nr:D-aminoacylase [Chitinophagaceae bacterium]